MSIPHDDDIKDQLLKLLSRAPDGTMHCQDVYDKLADVFPEVTQDEIDEPYRNSLSKWANRVQFARLHCVGKDYILRARDENAQGWGYWTITEAGKRYVESLKK